jgi:hypothetical protein
MAQEGRMADELERIWKKVSVTIPTFAWSERGKPRKAQDSQRSGRDPKDAPRDCKSTALLLDQLVRETISLHLPVVTEESHDNPQSGYAECEAVTLSDKQGKAGLWSGQVRSRQVKSALYISTINSTKVTASVV